MVSSEESRRSGSNSGAGPHSGSLIRSAVTLCLVPEARGGPFVFHGSVGEGCARAAALGFDAVEVFARAAEHVDARVLRGHLEDGGLKLAAMGTGAGWLLERLSLSHPEGSGRRRAVDFVKAIIDLAAGFGAPVIVGSMQGRAEGDVSRERALGMLAESLEQLGSRAHAAGVPLLVEPLNRYETNLLNTVADGLVLLQSLVTRNVKLLCDLFHMNIEEACMAEALRSAAGWVGHVHFADSNRRAVGWGHTDWGLIAEVLREVRFEGYVSAEVFPLPDAEAAARQAIDSFRNLFRKG